MPASVERGADRAHERRGRELSGRDVHRHPQIVGTEVAVPHRELADGLVDDPCADLDDAPRVLGDGDEVSRADTAQHRVVPPQERLETDGRPVGQRDDRLVDEPELCSVEGVAQRVLPLQAAGGPLPQRLVEHRGPRPAAVLGLVHRGVGVTEERLAGVAIGGVGDADARREEQLVPVDGDRPFEHGVDPRCQRGGVDAIRFAMQEHELVPAEPGDELVRERGGQPLRGGTQHLVTGLMPDPVVDDLEPVEVDEQDHHRVAMHLAALQVLVEAVDEQQAVREIGQRIVQRQPGELALGELAFGDVGRHADDCEERSGDVVHRGRRHEHLEHSSILATDPQITRPRVAPGDACGHLEHLGLAVDGRHDLLDEATDDLVAGPPVHPRRRLVPEQDPSLPVGADDGLPGGVEQVGLEPDRVLGSAADGDVTMVDDDAADRRVVEVVGHAELEPAGPRRGRRAP